MSDEILDEKIKKLEKQLKEKQEYITKIHDALDTYAMQLLECELCDDLIALGDSDDPEYFHLTTCINDCNYWDHILCINCAQNNWKCNGCSK